jgi:hypothetical protein
MATHQAGVAIRRGTQPFPTFEEIFMTNTEKNTEVTSAPVAPDAPALGSGEQVVPFFAARTNVAALTVKTSIRAGQGGRGEQLVK